MKDVDSLGSAAWKDVLQALSTAGASEALMTLARACADHPRISRLHPFVSVGRLCFSRCRDYPYTGLEPFVQSARGDDLVLFDPDGEILAQGSVDRVFAVLVENVPGNMPQAVAGNAVDLDCPCFCCTTPRHLGR